MIWVKCRIGGWRGTFLNLLDYRIFPTRHQGNAAMGCWWRVGWGDAQWGGWVGLPQQTPPLKDVHTMIKGCSYPWTKCLWSHLDSEHSVWSAWRTWTEERLKQEGGRSSRLTGLASDRKWRLKTSRFLSPSPDLCCPSTPLPWAFS